MPGKNAKFRNAYTSKTIGTASPATSQRHASPSKKNCTHILTQSPTHRVLVMVHLMVCTVFTLARILIFTLARILSGALIVMLGYLRPLGLNPHHGLTHTLPLPRTLPLTRTLPLYICYFALLNHTLSPSWRATGFRRRSRCTAGRWSSGSGCWARSTLTPSCPLTTWLPASTPWAGGQVARI